MEFKQAASHILDIVYEVIKHDIFVIKTRFDLKRYISLLIKILRNHRQLEILWVDKKQKLQNRYRILNFQQNIKNVISFRSFFLH